MLRIWDNMIDNKTLRLPEPQGRTFFEIYQINDTGLCNRMFYWEVCQILNKFHNFEYSIYLDEKFWPELTEMIQLPNTKLFPIYDIPENDRRSYLKGNSTPINTEDVHDVVVNNTKLNSNHLYSNFDYSMLANLDFIESKFNYISQIKLLDSDLDNEIKEFVKDMVGIHIRRGRGTIYSDSIKSLPNELQSKYITHRQKEGDFTEQYYIYDFIEDDKYFTIIDDILKESPTQKFYISHDLPDELLEYYLDKYPKSIYTKKYFYNFIKNKYTKTLDTHVKNIIDLFSLSYTKLIIKSPESTWSTFASRYRNIPHRLVSDTSDDILETYKSINDKL